MRRVSSSTDQQRLSERGTATTEIVLLSWIMVFFFAAAFQLFLVNQGIFRAITAAHYEHFRDAFVEDGGRNCAHGENCYYDGGAKHSRITWNPDRRLPEAEIPVVGMFKSSLGGVIRLISINPMSVTDECDPECKRTKMAVGTDFENGVFGYLGMLAGMLPDVLSSAVSQFDLQDVAGLAVDLVSSGENPIDKITDLQEFLGF